MARTTADTEHFQGADSKLLGRDSLFFWPGEVLLLYIHIL